MSRGVSLVLCVIALTAFTAGCDDPEARASLEVCLENWQADPSLAEILCQQSVDHAPGSRSGRQAAAILDDLAASQKKAAPSRAAQKVQLLYAQNIVKSHVRTP